MGNMVGGPLFPFVSLGKEGRRRREMTEIVEKRSGGDFKSIRSIWCLGC